MGMGIKFGAFLWLFVAGSALAAPPLYTGRDSTEARLTFEASVEIFSSRAPTEELALEKIDAQLSHLFGPLGVAKVSGVPKGDHEISNLSVKKSSRGVFTVSYTYEGTLVVEKGGPRDRYKVLLPRNPDRIYEAGIVRTPSGRETYPCTDPHYSSEGDFWYFWNPAQPGCPLKEGVDYDEITGDLERIPNSKKTYPEYERLADDGVITVSMLLGMDDPSTSTNPEDSKDVNAKNYLKVRKSLEKLGFKTRAWTKSEIQAVAPKAAKLPHVDELTKQSEKAKVVIRMFFGPTGIDEDSQAFHYFLKDAIEDQSLMIYDGHSGLGGHLDLPTIEATEGFKFKPSKSRYQIYFFNSCSSYTYYNTMFFGRKKSASDRKGTRNLDILTNGLATYFHVMHDTNMALLEAIDQWAEGGAPTSYQQLAKEIDSGNLFGVNGDEDNPVRQ